MADRLPEGPAAAFARAVLRLGKRADRLDVPGRTGERGNAAEGTDARQWPRLVAWGRVEHCPADDVVPLVSAEDVGPRSIEPAGSANPPDRGASRIRSPFQRKGRAAPPPC